jgi:serine/threonine protein kinase
MPEPDPRPPEERSSATGAWQPSSQAAPVDPPTVRSGSGSGSGALTGQGVGPRRVTETEFDPAPPLPRPGDRLDAFLLEVSIGVGGMGAVFRAHDGQLDRTVALKILPAEQARDVESVQRFYQEGRAAARLDHENIARVYTIGQSGPYHYIAFEFIEGSTLRQLVERDGVLSVGDTINYTLQIATALVHAAERGVVHRDVKPSNIIVTPQGRAKVVDMGLARRFERGVDHGLTQTGMTLGTFDYISPEQARDPRDVDVRSDLYSLGCTMYYMLAGFPPFPDGTVLQKLLQHQEEPPPDVRIANNTVPAELAAILLKLMAKDRDRRYQTPEQLVRDLLHLAGSLNLRSLGPERLVWMDAIPPPAWERHLVWGIPALAFAVIVAFLVWSGQSADSNIPLTFPEAVSPNLPRVAKSVQTAPTVAPAAVPKAETVVVAPRTDSPVRPASRDVSVHKNDDLTRLLAEAVPGSTLTLADAGPYDLRPGSAPLAIRDATLRAGVGVQPVVRLARDPATSRIAPALFVFRGGRLTIDGIEFQVDSDDRDAPLAAIRTEDTELTLVRCIFRRVGTKPTRGRTSALHLKETSLDDAWRGPSEVVVDSCHFEGGQYAVVAEGPVDLSVRDATFGGTRLAAFSCTNSDAAGQAAEIRIGQASVLLGDGPLFRVSGVPPRVKVSNSVIAPSGRGDGVLVVTDEPARLDWHGRDNLYERIGVFLQADRAASGFAPIRSFEGWADDPSIVREAGSTSSPERVWAEPDPALVLASNPDNPSLAFRLAPRVSSSRVGARRGPLGELNATSRIASNGPDAARGPVANPPAVPAPPVLVAKADPAQAPGDPVKPTPNDMPPTMPLMNDPPDEDTPAPMPPMQPAVVGTEPRPSAGAVPIDPGARTKETRPGPSSVALREAEPRLIRTPIQFASALTQAGGRGATLRLAADADFEMSPWLLRGTGPCAILGEPGKTRPRIRFRPKAGDNRLSDTWIVWLNLISGSLRLEGVDLILPRDDAPRSGGWAAFALAAGTDLSVNNCTVTIEGATTPSAVILVPAGVRRAAGFGELEPAPLATTVRVENSLLRSGGDVLDVAADRRIDFQIENSIVATAGSLLHGHGREPGKPAEPLKATLLRLTARGRARAAHGRDRGARLGPLDRRQERADDPGRRHRRRRVAPRAGPLGCPRGHVSPDHQLSPRTAGAPARRDPQLVGPGGVETVARPPRRGADPR